MADSVATVMTPDQVDALKAHVHALRLLVRDSDDADQLREYLDQFELLAWGPKIAVERV